MVRRSSEQPTLAPGQVALRWLGNAGFTIETRSGRTILIDPYLTRAELSTVGLGRLVPDRRLLAKAIPKADLILIGHAHFDHLLDAPAISARTGAPILGSTGTCRVAKRLDPGARCETIHPARRFVRQGVELTAVQCAHGETLLGVPFEGRPHRLPAAPLHVTDFRAEIALTWVIRVDGLTIVHASTAGLPTDPLALKKHVPEGADVLLVALALRENTPGYPRHLIDVLKPRIIIPHHPALPSFTLTDPLPDEVREIFEAFAKEEGPRVRIPRPFAPIVVRAERRAR